MPLTGCPPAAGGASRIAPFWLGPSTPPLVWLAPAVSTSRSTIMPASRLEKSAVSFPSPPSSWSRPSVTRTSSPRPPIRVSAPRPPISVSLPPLPFRTLSFSSPVIESSFCEPVTFSKPERTLLPAPPVAAKPAPSAVTSST